MSWEIRAKDGALRVAVEALEFNDSWMEERYVAVSIEIPCPIDFAIGDYLIYRNERFEINYDPGKIKCAPRFKKGDAFKYDNVKLNWLGDELTRCDFLDVVPGDNGMHFTGLPKFSFYGSVRDLAERIQANLDRAYGAGVWRVALDSETGSASASRQYERNEAEEMNVSVDTIKVSGALEILVRDFKTYYTIKGRTITIGAAGVPADHLFKYGRGKGLYEIEQNAEADQAIVTRLRAYGSTRNMPHRYYNSLSGADGKALIPDNMAVQHLMLPSFPYSTLDPYIDSPNIATLGVREGTVFFDGSDPDLPEIFPSIEGMTAEELKASGVSCQASGRLDEIVAAEQMTDNGVGKLTEAGASAPGQYESAGSTEAEPATFKVWLKDIGFDISEHVIAGSTPLLSFKSGKLGGREFEIVSCRACSPEAMAETASRPGTDGAPADPSGSRPQHGEDSEGEGGSDGTGESPSDGVGRVGTTLCYEGDALCYEVELKRVYDEGIRLWFPYADYNAEAGDRFVLLQIRMPEVYIKANSQKLLEHATAYLSKNDYSRSVYAPKIDEIFMARQHDAAMASGGAIKSLHDTLTAGMQLLFEDEDLGIDAAIFIDSLTIKEEAGRIPTYEVVLKEEKTVGTLQKIQNKIDSLAAGMGQGGGGYTASQIRELVSAYGGSMFLSKVKNDRSSGKISADLGFEAGEFAEGISGARIDGRGNAELESVKVRSYMEVGELVTNRQTVIEGDVLYTEGDLIEEAIAHDDGTYTLRLHEEWEGYTTAQIENNVLRGVYNDIASKYESIGSTVSAPQYGEGLGTAHGNIYYTSWMRVLTCNAAANTLDVVLYKDDETPAGKNFPPQPMMRIARWGNSGDGDPRYTMRQSCIVVSSTRGSIAKLINVMKPIIDTGNIAFCEGVLPATVCGAARLPEGSEGIYVKHIVAQSITQVDHLGRPTPTLVYYGEYDPDEEEYMAGDTPDPLRGIFPRHYVTYYGCLWLCSRTGTREAPSWLTTDWTFYQGDPSFRVGFEPVNTVFRPSNIDMELRVRAELYGQDVTGQIASSDVAWTRYSEDADGNPRPGSDALWGMARGSSGKACRITTADIDWSGGPLPRKVTFTATVTLRIPTADEGREGSAAMTLVDIR